MTEYEKSLLIKSGLRQPIISTLRLFTDVNEENSESLVVGTNIQFSDFWKHDREIHKKQFQKSIDLDALKKQAPKSASKNIFSFIKGNSNKKVDQNLESFNEKYAKAVAVNEEVAYLNAIKARHGYKCFFCGFVDKRFIEIHHINHNHLDNSKDNLVTACTLCHRQHHLLWLSMNDDAQIGYAPDSILDQTELNHMQRISIVMDKDEKYKKIFGTQSLLSNFFNEYTNNYTRPLHSVMLATDKKAQKYANFINTKAFEYSRTGVSMSFSQLELAIDKYETSKNLSAESNEVQTAVRNFKNLINLPKLIENDKNIPEDEHIFRAIKLVRSEMIDYVKKFEKSFNDDFNDNTEIFDCYDLADSLRSMLYSDFQKMKLSNYYLFFNSSIFTKEQIEYYRTLDDFNVEKWNFNKTPIGNK